MATPVSPTQKKEFKATIGPLANHLTCKILNAPAEATIDVECSGNSGDDDGEERVTVSVSRTRGKATKRKIQSLQDSGRKAV